MIDPYDEGALNDALAKVSETPYEPYVSGAIPWVDEDEQACFPLQGPIHSYIHWITQTTHTPTIFHLGSYLTQFCHRLASLGMRVEVGGRTKRPRLYALLVAPSGVGKSTPIHRANSFFHDHCGRVGSVIVPQSYPITADSTAAGISRLLQDSTSAFGDNECGLFVCEEAERVFTRGRQHPVDSLFCGLYDGHFTQHVTAKNIVEAKKGEDQVTKLTSPIVSLLFAMPEATFTGDGMDKASDTGLIPRFMVFQGRIREPKPFEVAMPEGRMWAEQMLDRCVEWFLQIRTAAAAGEGPWVDEQGDGLIRVKLSEAAAKVYFERVTRLDLEEYAKLKENDDLRDVDRNFRAYRLRAYDQAYTVAALYALSQQRLVIYASDMQRALNLTDMSINYMKNTLILLGKTDAGLAGEYIMTMLRGSSVPLRERYMRQRFLKKFPNMYGREFTQALETLEQAGLVERHLPPAGEKKTVGRPPVPTFTLNENPLEIVPRS